MMTTTRDPVVHVVDDDTDVRESLQMLLGSVGIWVRTYPDADSFLVQNRLDGHQAPERPACMILDMRMPRVSGMTLLEKIHQSNVQMPVIVVTGHGDIPMSVRAMKLGAADFVTKPFNHQELLDLVQGVLRDAEARASTTPQAEVLDNQQSLALWATLTRREREVFEQIVDGSTNKAIGIDLGISTRTVETHRARIMEKLQARSLVDLVMLKVNLQSRT